MFIDPLQGNLACYHDVIKNQNSFTVFVMCLLSIIYGEGFFIPFFFLRIHDLNGYWVLFKGKNKQYGDFDG